MTIGNVDWHSRNCNLLQQSELDTICQAGDHLSVTKQSARNAADQGLSCGLEAVLTGWQKGIEEEQTDLHWPILEKA